MSRRRIKMISDVKTMEDLQRLKLEKKYTRDLKKLELQASLIQMQMELSPESIKETILEEGQSYLKRLASDFMPAIVLNLFRKYTK
tara:strand:+ start:8552 stop:8809 length:258 start_codon:yes stop_codon:yes gene_type:complete